MSVTPFKLLLMFGLFLHFAMESFSRDGYKPLYPCSDYEMLIVNTNKCVSRCPIRCVNGTCFEDGECPCEGYYTSSDIHLHKGLVCALECLPGCISAGGYCATPEVCVCRKGYYFDALARRCRKVKKFLDRCFGRCLYGTCTSERRCLCAQGYVYRASLFGQLCVPVCKQNCGRHAYCFLPNMCTCKKKYHNYERDGRCRKDSNFIEYLRK